MSIDGLSFDIQKVVYGIIDFVIIPMHVWSYDTRSVVLGTYMRIFWGHGSLREDTELNEGILGHGWKHRLRHPQWTGITIGRIKDFVERH